MGPGTKEEQTKRGSLRNLFLLGEDVVFLNHGSFGACPRPVFEAYQRWQCELEREPVEFLARRHNALLAEARSALAQYVGAERDDLVFVTNATTGMNIVARSLPLGTGDEVLSTDHEYGAVDRMWRFLCQKAGASYVRAPVRVPIGSAEEVVEAVWSRVTPRTRILSLSHITSPTAIVFPVVELVRRAREAGITTVVDGAHAPGQIPLDLPALGADFYAGNCHKWMMAPKGAGFLYARRERQGLLEPLVASWGLEPEKPGPSRFVDLHEWQGTRDLAAFLSVPDAIGFMRDHDWDLVRGACHDLVRRARVAVSEITGLPPLTPDSADWYVQIAAFPLPAVSAEAFQRRLFDEFRIEIPVIPWNGRALLRLSVQGYNSQEDVDRLVAALASLLVTA
jgi:isopenicillin-N epimerase